MKRTFQGICGARGRPPSSSSNVPRESTDAASSDRDTGAERGMDRRELCPAHGDSSRYRGLLDHAAIRVVSEPGPGAVSRGRLLPPGHGRRVLLLVWLVSAAYVFPFRLRGWGPTDEGVFSQAAERVWNGEVPHRDFPETYTGGLSYWNALAFRVFGLRLTSLRLALFLWFLAFVPAVFAIASRFGPPILAGLMTLLAVAWSLPNYFAGSVSWYNLFLATWGTLALLRHVETGQRRWLVLAGALAGISCLFKVTGVHFLAASLLFLLYRENQLSASPGQLAEPRRISAFLLFKTAGIALFLAVLLVTVRSRPDAMTFLNFIVPAATVCGFLIWREFSEGGGPFARRFAALMRLILPAVAGFLLPLLLFLLVFALAGALPDLVRGVIVGAGVHVTFFQMSLPPLSAIWPAVPYTIVLSAGSLAPFRFARPLRVLLAAALAAALWLSGVSEEVYRVAWYSARFLGVSTVFAACLRLEDAHRLGFWKPETRQKIFLLAAVAAIVGLVQFPYSHPIYFFYFAPLVALAIFALVGSEPQPPRLLHAGMFAFYFLFALLRTNPVYIYTVGHRFERYNPTAVLDLPRAGGIRVPAKDAEVYGALVPLVQEKSGGKPIYAGPDCGVVQFLSGLPDALSYGAGSPRDPMQRPDSVFRSLAAKGTRAVVLNRDPLFSKPLRPEVVSRFEELFPHRRIIGPFVACWRD
jgi:hypothetical protein